MNLQFTLDEFMALDMCDRGVVVLKDGVYLANYDEPNTWIKLYSLNNFYVEVVLNLKENKVLNVIPFKDPDPLDKYLNDIQLPFN